MNNSKIHISSNFTLSITFLIMFDVLLLRPSLHYNTPLHFTTLIDTSLPLIYTSLPSHLALHIYISYCSVSPHITKLDTYVRLLSAGIWRFGLTCLHLQNLCRSEDGKRQAFPKHWYFCTRLHDGTPHKIMRLILVNVTLGYFFWEFKYINQPDATVLQVYNFFTFYFAQHVSGVYTPIIRSLKLH